MFSISGVTQPLGLDAQLLKSPSFGKDRDSIDDPNADKVSLSSGQPEPEVTYQYLAMNSSNPTPGSTGSSKQTTEKNEESKEPDRLATLMQQVLDGKLGIDRKKLEEIEEKIDELVNKEGELTEAEKSQLEILQKQKEQLIKEGAKKLTEEGI